jgi:hypothetical protein
MKPYALALGFALSLALLGRAIAQPPPDFGLEQNDPNPFCGETRITFALHQAVYVTLSIWNPDSTAVVRTLNDGMHPAGYHSSIWDQRDDQGALLVNGSYPYVLIAAESPGGPPIFEASLRATIDCLTPVEPRSWGKIKAIYR